MAQCAAASANPHMRGENAANTAAGCSSYWYPGMPIPHGYTIVYTMRPNDPAHSNSVWNCKEFNYFYYATLLNAIIALYYCKTLLQYFDFFAPDPVIFKFIVYDLVILHLNLKKYIITNFG